MDRELSKIQWSESYSVGNQELDRQHQHILDLINQVVEILQTDTKESEESTMEVMSRLMRLYEVGQQHFYFEEIYLSRTDYDDLKGQQRSHNGYTDRLLRALSEGIASEERRNKLVAFLLEWWNNHILVDDMAYKSHLSSR